MANYLTFGDLIEAVEQAVKMYSSSMQPLVKSFINQVYLNEILQCDNLYPFHWLHAVKRYALNDPQSVAGVTIAAQAVITCTAHGFKAGDIVSFWNIVGTTELNFDYVAANDYLKLYIVDDTDIAANSFKLNDMSGAALSSAVMTAWTSGGTILHHGWSLGANILEVKDVGIYDGMPLDPITWADLIANCDAFISDSSGTPSEFFHYQTFSAAGAESNLLMTFPGAQETKIVLAGIHANPARLSADTDIPRLPYQFHDAIISGAITRLAEYGVQVENAVIWPGLYKMQVESIKTYNRKWWAQHRKEGAQTPYLL